MDIKDESNKYPTCSEIGNEMENEEQENEQENLEDNINYQNINEGENDKINLQLQNNQNNPNEQNNNIQTKPNQNIINNNNNNRNTNSNKNMEKIKKEKEEKLNNNNLLNEQLENLKIEKNLINTKQLNEQLENLCIEKIYKDINTNQLPLNYNNNNISNQHPYINNNNENENKNNNNNINLKENKNIKNPPFDNENKFFKEENDNKIFEGDEKFCMIKINIKLTEDRFETLEVIKGIDIFTQINEFCEKKNIDSELVSPIFGYVEKSLKALGLFLTQKTNTEFLEKLKYMQKYYEDHKELDNQYHSDTEVFVGNNSHYEGSLMDSNTSF